MSYNIENGGISIYKKTGNMRYVNKYIDLIKLYNIDIVCFQEVKMRGIDISEIIAKKIGYHHQYFFDKTNYYKNKYYHQSIISKYPIVDVYDKLNMCRININGAVINIVNIHLDDEPYMPYSLKGIDYTNTPKNVKPIDVDDLSFITKRETIEMLMNDKMITNHPTILMGDFNEPSHLDYKYIKWKTSKFLMKNGFSDVARVIYKNVKKNPLYTVDINDKNYSPERIDIMYCNKGLKPLKYKNIYNKLSDHIPIIGMFEIGIANSNTNSNAKVKTNAKSKKIKNKTRKISKL